jgi:dUTP pyrophosphatase
MKNEKLKICKVKTVKTPIRSTSGSAGIDFFIPDNYEEIKIFPHEDILIPSGIKVLLKKNTALLAVSKSGIATKNKLAVGACLIDEDYSGEIHLHVYNFSNEIQVIKGGQKLIQFIYIPYIKDDIELVEEIIFEKNERNENGFGSTQVKF